MESVFWRNLATILAYKGISFKELTRRLGFNYNSFMSFKIRGQDLRTNDTLKIAKYLGITVENLYADIPMIPKNR